MRILHVSEVDIGGTLIVLERLAASQLEHFGSKNVICLLPNSALSEITQIPRSCIITFTRKRRGATSFLSLLLNFSKIMFQYRPHILHIHSTFAGFVCRVFLAIVGPVVKCKVIYCPHAWSFSNKTIVQTWTFQMVERVLSRYSDLIICVSNYERSAGILAGIRPERLVVISNGVAFPDAPKPALITDNQLVEALFVGRLSIQKGFDILSRALRQIPPGRIHLTVIGPRSIPAECLQGVKAIQSVLSS